MRCLWPGTCHNSDGLHGRKPWDYNQRTGSIDVPEKVFRIFPNPTTGKVTLDSNGVKIDGIHVYDMFGQKLYSDFESFTGQKTIDLPLLNGIFLIKPFSKSHFAAQKITIQN